MKKAETSSNTHHVLEQEKRRGQRVGSGRPILAVSGSLSRATQITCHSEASAVTCAHGNSHFFPVSPSNQQHFGS